MKLSTLLGSKDIKEFTVYIKRNLERDDDMYYGTSAIWISDRILKYLQRHWKSKLRNKGIAWQKFLRMHKLYANDFIVWTPYYELTRKESVSRVTSIWEDMESLEKDFRG